MPFSPPEVKNPSDKNYLQNRNLKPNNVPVIKRNSDIREQSNKALLSNLARIYEEQLAELRTNTLKKDLANAAAILEVLGNMIVGSTSPVNQPPLIDHKKIRYDTVATILDTVYRWLKEHKNRDLAKQNINPQELYLLEKILRFAAELKRTDQELQSPSTRPKIIRDIINYTRNNLNSPITAEGRQNAARLSSRLDLSIRNIKEEGLRLNEAVTSFFYIQSKIEGLFGSNMPSEEYVSYSKAQRRERTNEFNQIKSILTGYGPHIPKEYLCEAAKKSIDATFKLFNKSIKYNLTIAGNRITSITGSFETPEGIHFAANNFKVIEMLLRDPREPNYREKIGSSDLYLR